MNLKFNRSIFRIIVITAIILALIFILYYSFFKKPFLYAGTLEVTNTDISARLSADIEYISVWEGDRVNKGQVLIKFECDDYKIAAKLANENYDRNIVLLKPGWVTPERIDQLRKEKDQANTYVEWCTLDSPLDGKVLTRYHEPGEWMTNGTKILTIANIRDIWAYIYVPQPTIARLKVGMKLKAYLPELNNRVFMGTIIKINDEAEFTPKNVQTQSERERLIYGVKISFLGENEEEILKPGMTVEVELPQ